MSLAKQHETTPYALPIVQDTAVARPFPSAPVFTSPTLRHKRFTEVTTPVFFTLSFFLPTTNALNSRLDSHVQPKSANYGQQVDTDRMKEYAIDSILTGARTYADAFSRIAIQTGIAMFLIEHPTQSGNAVVYLWDAYPRIHEKYIGDLLEGKLHLPRFLAKLAGPATPEYDLKIWDVKLPFLNAFDDAFKRIILHSIGDIVVSNVRIGIEGQMAAEIAAAQQRQQKATPGEGGSSSSSSSSTGGSAKKPNPFVIMGARLVGNTVSQSCTLTMRILTAAIGNHYGGGFGEYWSEYTGMLLGGVLGNAANMFIIAKAVSKLEKKEK